MKKKCIQCPWNISDVSHRINCIFSILTSYQAEWILQIHQDCNEMLAFQNTNENTALHLTCRSIILSILVTTLKFKARSEKVYIYKKQV